MNEKLDLYMPFYGKDFFAAMEGQREIIVSSYIRALWHYWQHAHCKGLKNNSEHLRLICHCPEKDWAEVGAIIFGEMFYLEGGLWQQDRSKSEYVNRQNIYDFRVKAGEKGAATRWGNRPPPPKKRA